MEIKFTTFLSIGTILMMIVMILCGRWRGIKTWKTILIPVLLMFAGVLGTRLLFYFENGNFTGTSFYGAILLVPVLFLPVALIFWISYGKLMDICAPAECIMLALMKVQCAVNGCCVGRVLSVDTSGKEIRFPSQIVELIFALAIMVALMLIMHKKESVGKIYPYYMILYGASRFLLNLLRETTPFIWILPAGNFWSLVSIALGVIWLFAVSKISVHKTKEAL